MGHPGDPAGADQNPACIPAAAHSSAVLIQSHLVALSAASGTDLWAYLLAASMMASMLNTLRNDHPAKPLHSTSIVLQQIIHPLLHQLLLLPSQLCFLSLASSMCIS